MGNNVFNLKRIRTLRNMTPTELGKACDFEQSTAYVRIADYEKGKKKPKEDMVDLMSRVLGVIPEVLLSAPSLQTQEQRAWSLLEIDEELSIDIEDGKISFKNTDFNGFIKEWEKKKKQLKNNEITLDEYYLWKISRRL